MKQLRTFAKAFIGSTVLLIPLAALAADVPTEETSTQDRVMFRSVSDQQGRLAQELGLTILNSFQQDGQEVSLAAVNAGLDGALIVERLWNDPDVINAEVLELAALPYLQSGRIHESDVISDVLRNGSSATSCLGRAWSGYADQQAAEMVNLTAAHAARVDCGAAATVAVIDTAIDVDHPVLRHVMLPGYDFRNEAAVYSGNSGGLDQSIMAILEQQSVAVEAGMGNIAMLSASGAPIVDAELAAALDSTDLPPFFGHGTMVAGIVHLVAPAAKIMPLEVFDDQGVGSMFDVVRAIYWAVAQGADVINMSFSTDRSSPELVRALRFAAGHGVVCVAAAGNDGERRRAYPAAIRSTIGVASTDQEDDLSDFSNFGSGLVVLAAPGVGLVSTFPNRNYAAGWGTSFSAPLVSGTLALIEALIPEEGAVSVRKKIRALRNGSVPIDDLEGKIGSGRLDISETVSSAYDLN